jgi:DNA-binding Lrp family transcriptional regulator
MRKRGSSMPIYIETIMQKWFGNEKNLNILNGIVRHWSDKQISSEYNIRIDRVANYRSKLRKKGLLTAGFFSINYEKLGLVQVVDFPPEPPSSDDIFLTYLVRISRPFGYMRARLLPKNLVEDGYHFGAGHGLVNTFTTPFVRSDFSTEFEKAFGGVEQMPYEKKSNEKDAKIDLLSIYICKEVQKGVYGARTLSKTISGQISEQQLDIQPSISNVNRRLRELKNSGVVRKSNPLNLVPLRPYYNLDSAIVNKNENFHNVLAALASLNVMARYSDVLNMPGKAYISLQYHFSQKWDILGIFKKYLDDVTFFDHAPSEIRRTIPFEYFRDEVLKEKKWI